MIVPDALPSDDLQNEVRQIAAVLLQPAHDAELRKFKTHSETHAYGPVSIATQFARDDRTRALRLVNVDAVTPYGTIRFGSNAFGAAALAAMERERAA